jgi:phosphate uptake regulator
VAGVEEERKKRRKKKKRKGKQRRLGFTRISSRPPSAADPRVVDLRVERVEPDHRSSACGQARDLIGDEISASAARCLIGASDREEAPLRPLDGGAFTQR